MKDNLRLAFSVIWLIAFTCSLAAAVVFILTWGGHVDFLASSLVVLGISTLIVILTSL